MPIATPEVYAEMLDRAKEHHFAFPAINCTSSETINAAIKAGTIDADRVERWKKLLAEDAYNSASVAKRHASGRLLVKPVRNASGAKRP